MRLDQLTTLVTGASGGLGRCFAGHLLAAGGRVAAGDTNAAGLRQLASEHRDAGERLFVARVDVTEEGSVESFFNTAEEALGPANALVNCAGLARDGLLASRREGGLHPHPLAQWRKVVDVNLTGTFLMTRELAARCLAVEDRPAVVVNLSSLARAGNPGQSGYAAAKAGVDAATRTWALELAPAGIRVGAVAPGVIDTTFLDSFREETVEALRASVPLGRLGTADEVWLAVRFILECDFFTGRVLEVDGGAAMGAAT